MLADYRRQCEKQRNYDEARQAFHRYQQLRQKETMQELSAVRRRQEKELFSLNAAQQKQTEQFDYAWNEYVTDYETTAYNSLLALRDKQVQEHQTHLAHAARELEKQVRPSKQLLDLRKQEEVVARLGLYAEAKQLRHQAEALETKEVKEARRKVAKGLRRQEEAILKKHQQAFGALLKRIQRDRVEQRRHRDQDGTKLRLRNRNVYNSILQKQASEAKHALEGAFRSHSVSNHL